LTKDQVITMLREKMEMFSTKPSDAFRQITRIFGSSGDCDLKRLEQMQANLVKNCRESSGECLQYSTPFFLFYTIILYCTVDKDYLVLVL